MAEIRSRDDDPIVHVGSRLSERLGWNSTAVRLICVTGSILSAAFAGRHPPRLSGPCSAGSTFLFRELMTLTIRERASTTAPATSGIANSHRSTAEGTTHGAVWAYASRQTI